MCSGRIDWFLLTIVYFSSLSLQISELELLYSRASGLPIYIVESEKLSQRISSAKVY